MTWFNPTLTSTISPSIIAKDIASCGVFITTEISPDHVMQLSIVSPTTPGRIGIGQDNWGFDLYFCQIPHLWGSFSYQNPTKAPVIPRNHVGDLIHR